MRKRTRLFAGAFAGVVICAAAGYSGWCMSLEDSVIWRDVCVNGVNLKGLSKKEAKNALQAQFEKDYQDAEITIKLEDQEFRAEIFPILHMDTDELIREAYLPGHGEWYVRGLDWLREREAGQETLDIEPAVSDFDAVHAILEDTGIDKVDTYTETSCELTDTALLIQKGRSGVTADMDKLEEQVQKLLEKGDYTAEIECPVIRQELKNVDLTPYYEEVHTEMMNASFTDNGKILPSKEGISFDLDAAQEAVSKAEEGEALTIDFTVTEPEVTEADLRKLLYKDVLGEYETYGGGTSNRIANITLACQACDGVIIQPGKTFSYNETLGERTAERGYKSATVYVNGQPTQGIGGGICQVSSTLFAACLYADLEIIQRSNHSRTVAYLPMGMDAAVSWGGPDLQFKNNTKFPIKLRVSYTDGRISVQILGLQEKEKVIEISTEKINGLTVRTYREHYDAQGELLEKEEVAYSRYLA